MGIGRTKHQRKQAFRMMVIRLLTSATLGALIVAGFYFYDYLTTTEKLAIQEIEFKGLRRVQPAEIERAVADLRGQNILLVPLENYAARFTRHPRIKGARFRKVLPDRVVCTVEERVPVALVFAGRLLEVDEEGMIMTADGLTDMLDLPIISGLDRETVKEGRLCEDRRLTGALRVLAICKDYGGKFAQDISELRIGNRGINIVSLKEGMVLLLGKTDFEGRLNKFFLMRNTIAQQDASAKLVDLRFEDQIVLRSGIQDPRGR